jgi:hypothetical protein
MVVRLMRVLLGGPIGFRRYVSRRETPHLRQGRQYVELAALNIMATM